MSGEHIFVDTNILVYAHDKDAGKRYLSAKEGIRRLWQEDLPPSVSVQVLQEFYVNLIRLKVPVDAATATIRSYMEWDVIDNDCSLLLEGIRVQARWKLSFWDALILSAAKRARATVVWSEDLNPGQNYDGIRVVNPLAGNLQST